MKVYIAVMHYANKSALVFVGSTKAERDQKLIDYMGNRLDEEAHPATLVQEVRTLCVVGNMVAATAAFGRYWNGEFTFEEHDVWLDPAKAEQEARLLLAHAVVHAVDLGALLAVRTRLCSETPMSSDEMREAGHQLQRVIRGFTDALPECSEGGHANDDNPGKAMCKTCEDWQVTTDEESTAHARTLLELLAVSGASAEDMRGMALHLNRYAPDWNLACEAVIDTIHDKEEEERAPTAAELEEWRRLRNT